MTTSLTIVRRIKAAPEAVFAAFIEPDKIKQWWGPDSGPVTLAEVAARQDGRFHVRFRMEDGSEHGSTGTFTEYDPPHRLAMNWEWEDDPGQVSRVEVSLRAVSGGTELTFTHERLPDEASRRSHKEGWNGALDKLEAMFGSASDYGSITVTALKWVPPFAAGQVRDHRVRWILNEVGWPYAVRLIDAPTQASGAYRAKQPFGQVPLMEEEGRPPMFETGAIVLDVATRANKLMPKDANGRAQVLAWVFAALNSIEPSLQNVAEVEYFLKDEEDKNKRRPLVMEMADKRLGELQDALGDKQWLVGDGFTVADLMMASVLKIARRLDILEPFPKLVTYHDRCLDRAAYRKAVDDQWGEIAEHAPEDMGYAEEIGGQDGQ